MFNYRDSAAALQAKLEVLGELEMKHEDDRRGWFLFAPLVFVVGASGVIWNPWERDQEALFWIGVVTLLGAFASVVIGIRAWHQLYEVRRFIRLIRQELDYRERFGRSSVE